MHSTAKFAPSPSGLVFLSTRSGNFRQLVGPGKPYKVLVALKRIVLAGLDFEASLRQARPLKIQVTDQRQWLRTGQHPYLHGLVTSIANYRDGKVVTFKNLPGGKLQPPSQASPHGWEYFSVWIPDSHHRLAGVIA